MNVLTKLRIGQCGSKPINNLIGEIEESFREIEESFREIEENFQVALKPTTIAPVSVVFATGTLTLAVQPMVGDTITIGEKLYTFTADTATEDGEIFIGADLSAAKVNVIAAINGTDSVNIANLFVSASDFETNDCTLTSLIGGVVGNSIPTTETFTGETNVFASDTLLLGVDGTVPTVPYEMKISSSKIYVNVSGDTINSAVWKSVSLS